MQTGLQRLAGRIILSDGWARAAIACLAGALLVLGLAPFNVPAVGFVSFPILVWLVDGASGAPGAGLLRRSWPAFRVGWLFGFGYFVAGLWWLGAAMLVDAAEFWWALPLAILALPAALAVYWGLATALARLVWSDGPARLAALAASLALFECLRGVLFTGFTWNTVGAIAAPVPMLMGSVSLIGLNGLTLVSLFVFSLPALLAYPTRGRGLASVLGAALVALHVGFGAWHLTQAPTGHVPGVSLRLVQPNILQGQKWDPAEAERIFSRQLELTAGPRPPEPILQGADEAAQAASDAPGRRLVIWPESAFPFILTQRPDAVGSLAETLAPGDTLIAGATRMEGEGARARFFNSIYVIAEDGTILDAQDKLHLVPFGEYLPFQAVLERWGVNQLTHLPGGFSAGASRRLLAAGAGGPRFLPLICYEIIFPGEIERGGERPDFILNVTNDAWYGQTPGPYQHLRQAQFTAVALGLPLVRAANTGISIVTDSAGRPVAGLALGQGGAVDAVLPLPGAPTLYAKMGESLFFALWAIAAFLAIMGVVRFRHTVD
ncbi:apolipoprotein N-acyltransferase [Aureimonas sp. AU40]|uniref:apolipoprotein N-acyltransferase n=1 Tax=Aureimonas sp. AU40 TaxID=1637747 RepID=UPI000781FE7B|nr:apolipoprotein N-acyltransferase [Aureimonas sp. AU40]